ncbi:MAG: hypothetical protein JXB19_11120, partial [Bacteroidales bacterium]|nr:hypothetical protein [Bacteroidales bacterium]
MMDEHIIALLNNNLRVIIPDFGAFIVRQKEPKVIVFNEFLRYNDGLLIDYIAKAEQIEKEIAEQRITIFAEEATKTLESGKDLQIKGLGMLTRDPSGKINFVSESSHTVKERSRSEREAGRRATKSDVVKGTAGASASDAVKKVSDLKSPESEKTLSKGSENELIRDQDIKKEAPAEGIKEKMAARAADKPEIKEESQPERKAPQQPEPESKEESVKVSKSVAETGTQPVDKAKPETAAKAETGPVTKAKPETAAKAETG